jgi:hypothetical protein
MRDAVAVPYLYRREHDAEIEGSDVEGRKEGELTLSQVSAQRYGELLRHGHPELGEDLSGLFLSLCP